MSYESGHDDIEIQTLLQSSHGIHPADDLISNVIQPRYQKFQEVSRLGRFPNEPNKWWVNGKALERQRSSDSESSYGSADESHSDAVKVFGADQGDLPTEYTVHGLRQNEFPVIGTYVDKRVIPGFKYKVRKLGSKKYMFGGRSLQLLSVGMGYGKRITMEGDNLNTNDNYFYSDTHAEGYGFSLQVLSAGDKYVIYDEAQRLIGGATIERVQSQKELSTSVLECGSVQKTVSVVFGCTVRYESEANCLSLLSSQRVELQASLVITKAKKSRHAQVKCINDVGLEHVGFCTFELA